MVVTVENYSSDFWIFGESVNLRSIFAIESSRPNLGIIISFGLRILNLVFSFITIPILLRKMSDIDYSIWVTLTSLLVWISLMDFGVGNGLKNHIAKNIDQTNTEESKTIIGTFQLYLAFSVVISILVLILIRIIPVLNEKPLLSVILYIPAIFLFPFTTFSAVLQGRCENTYLSFILLIKKMWILLFLPFSLILNLSTLDLAAILFNVFSIVFALILLISVKRKYPFTIKTIVDFRNVVSSFPLLKIGIKFFSLQITSLILFNIGNYIVYSFFNTQVIYYDTLNKVFFNLISFFNINISIFWTQYTTAMGRNDYNRFIWLKGRLKRNYAVFIGIATLISLILPKFIFIWTHARIIVSYADVIPFWILVILQSGNYYGAVLLNASGKINLQVLVALLSCLFFLALIFCLMRFDIISTYIVVPIATSITLVPGFILYNLKSVLISKEFLENARTA